MIFLNTCSLEAVKALNRAFSRHFNIFLMTADALPRSAHAHPHGKNGRKHATFWFAHAHSEIMCRVNVAH